MRSQKWHVQDADQAHANYKLKNKQKDILFLIRPKISMFTALALRRLAVSSRLLSAAALSPVSAAAEAAAAVPKAAAAVDLSGRSALGFQDKSRGPTGARPLPPPLLHTKHSVSPLRLIGDPPWHFC